MNDLSPSLQVIVTLIHYYSRTGGDYSDECRKMLKERKGEMSDKEYRTTEYVIDHISRLITAEDKY